jgi:hypothetical protein
MVLKKVKTGANVFVGNDAVVPPGSVIPKGALIGIKSKPPENHLIAPNDTWFGSPPIKLPVRQKFDALSENWTYEPPLWKKFARAVFEAVHVSLSTMLFITFGTWAVEWFGADLLAGGQAMPGDRDARQIACEAAVEITGAGKGGRAHETHAQHAGFARLSHMNNATQSIHIAQHATRFVQQGGTSGGELDRVLVAIKEQHAQVGFEFFDVLGERRLRDVQTCSCSPEVQFLGHGQEVTQATQFHRIVAIGYRGAAADPSSRCYRKVFRRRADR